MDRLSEADSKVEIRDVVWFLGILGCLFLLVVLLPLIPIFELYDDVRRAYEDR